MDYFEITGVETGQGLVILSLISKQKGCVCPVCGTIANRVHSYYFRTIKELPAFDYKVFLKLRSRKFHCDNLVCKRKVFTERYEEYFTAYKRVSKRLERKLLKIALLVGGNSGAILCKTLNIPISSSGLIRLIHQQELTKPEASDALGIDDWAYKKGNVYGTAIVDLVQHKIIDLLPDREASTVEAWLKERPTTKIITRDRFSGYATGITNALPYVTQVADRWHLLKNMGDALQKMLERKRQELRPKRYVQRIPSRGEQTDAKEKESVKKPMTKRQIQLQQVKEYNAQGITIRAISRALKICRQTVRKYIDLDEPPRKNGARTNISKFAEYLQARISEDPTLEVMQLWKEIKGNGFSGCRTTVYEYLKNYSKGRKQHQTIILPQIAPWLPRKVSLLLYRKKELLSPKEKKLIHELRNRSKEIKLASAMATRFRELMEEKKGHLLKAWVNEVQETSLKELKSFARGLLSDFTAVENAFTLDWSNGQVEGQINKLKTIKRQMYGRASFELLRKRMVLGYG